MNFNFAFIIQKSFGVGGGQASPFLRDICLLEHLDGLLLGGRGRLRVLALDDVEGGTELLVEHIRGEI